MSVTYHWLGKTLDEMIQFSDWHGLRHVSGVLAHAKANILHHLEEAHHHDYHVEEKSMRDALDDMIAYCRLHSLHQVVDQPDGGADGLGRIPPDLC